VDIVDASTTSRCRTSQPEDMNVEWTQKIYTWAVYIYKNVTLIDWKFYYMHWDLKNTNATPFYDSDVTMNVNGMAVNWTKRPNTWFSNFGSLSEEAEAAGDMSTLEIDAAKQQEDSSSSRRYQSSLSELPPR